MEKKNQLKLSYESDGKMGNQKKKKGSKREEKDFFNTTQESE